ncbi:uncharacterized protein LOC112348998 [Selaginella moellendorffii]|uniref:uncharacterized protein LOC112348012 n=1 Tax=Selaginella moellendorffii TaxID=88036 RepID=UPI000D1CA0A5|nr:uncharacterized protein LOC112348012 [Selaginella moellendorffii]XP_024535637.1 uncharacterized protein LOC112348012 [Selaginella moellendorffii]XP_024538317.1 uncharacterized protein LOC112348998 [Selaginella moellendorffii]|eukprot:XP_024535636.1 uncharacterized protein LOC112348012 [Selaginella moellendorffii]
MPSRFAPRNRLGVRKKNQGKSEMTVSPSSSNGDFLKADLDEEGWKQSRVLRCSYRVLQLIGNATLTEKVIREALGNNPDTSKALRLLLKRKMIKRVGYGGRSCPFHYQSLSRSPSKETDEKAELTSSSSAENTDMPDEERHDNKTNTMSNALVTTSTAVVADAVVAIKRDPSETTTNGTEEPADEVLVATTKLKVSKASKEPKKAQVKATAAVAKAVAKAGPGGLTEQQLLEIPVPGWRLVDD